MGRVRWTAEAESWLREIRSYIARDNPAAARRTIQRIYEKAKLLERHPEIGHLYHPAQGDPIRILLFGHYRIAYRRIENDVVEILGVYHGALDLDKRLS